MYPANTTTTTTITKLPIDIMATNGIQNVLPAMATKPKFIFFTDFDGTITSSDSNDYLTDNYGMGRETRMGLNKQVLTNTLTFRSAFKQMLDSISTPFDKCTEALLQKIELDSGFKKFYDWAKENNIPIVILSGGMTPLIRALLNKLMGEDTTMQIISNDVGARPGKSINEEGGWEMVFRDDRFVNPDPCLLTLKVTERYTDNLLSDFGHDKSIAIRPYAALPPAERPTMFYAGDGVSDLSAAKETDLLFAKRGHDLVTYCVNENVPFFEFETWNTILEQVKSIVGGQKTVEQVSKEGIEAFAERNKSLGMD